MNKSPVKELFTEKFRPQKLEQLIAPKRIKSELSKGLVQNILLHGSPGIGKCVDENTNITVKNKNTGEIMEITIKDFMELLE